MCGIVYAFNKSDKPASKRVLKRYTKQRNRGEDGFGFVAIDDERNVQSYQRFQNEKQVRKALEKVEARHVLFHHRYPTSTENVPEGAHPIMVKHKELKHTYYVVHNGVISNTKTLKPLHDELGYKYNTAIDTIYRTAKGTMYTGKSQFNDSETLAIELARTIEGLQPSVRATGTIAFIVLQANKAGTKVRSMYYGTNGGNPLTVTDDNYGVVIASEGGKPITANVVYKKDFATDQFAIADVPLISYYSPSAPYTSPYSWKPVANSYHAHNGDEYVADVEEDDYVPAEDNEIGLTELYDMLYEVEADIEIAKQANESVEREELEIEREGILLQITEIEEGAMYSKRIGF